LMGDSAQQGDGEQTVDDQKRRDHKALLVSCIDTDAVTRRV